LGDRAWHHGGLVGENYTNQQRRGDDGIKGAQQKANLVKKIRKENYWVGMRRT